MSIEVKDSPANVLVVELDDQLEKDDFTEVFTPAVERLVAATGELRVVLVYPDFDGISAGAAWEDFKTGMGNWRRWRRIALVTDEKWMERSLKAFAWMKPGDVKHFPMSERPAAITWAAGS
jgi:hypothetical protein